MPYTDEEKQQLGVTLESGDDHYRAYVGAPHAYSLYGANCFNLLTSLGMREHHTVLDIGCGSLRVGRLLIPFLLEGHYGAVEPNPRLVQEAIEKELGPELLQVKDAQIEHNDRWEFPELAKPYDFALAHSIFSHASQDQIRNCLKSLKPQLAPTGFFAATYCPVPFLSRQEEYTGEEWVYPGLTYFRPETMRTIARECGFRMHEIRWTTFVLQQVWVVFTHGEQKVHVPRLPQWKWVPKYWQVENPVGNLIYRTLVKLKLRQPEGWPGGDRVE